MIFKLRGKIARIRDEIKAYNFVKQYSHNFGDFIFYKCMNFRSSYLEDLAKTKNHTLNAEARIKASEYFLETLLLQYNTLLFNCEKTYMELINYTLFVDFIIPLFDKKTFDQYLIILMTRSLANVIFKRIWARLVLLRQRAMKMEENSRKQKEENQDRKMADMGLSATEQIQKQVDKSLEPKLEELLAKKVKTTALKIKPTKKDQHYKFNPKEHFAKKESHVRDHSVDSESTLAKFAKQNFGRELSSFEEKMSDSDVDDRKPSGKGEMKPSGKGYQFKKGNCKPFF